MDSGKKKIEIESFLDFQFVSNPVFSPEGVQVAFQVKQACLDRNHYRSDLYLYVKEKGEIRRLTSAGDAGSFCWSDEDRLLFSAIRSEEHQRLAAADKDFTVFQELAVDGGEAIEAFVIPLPVKAIRKLDDDRLLLTTFMHAGWSEFYQKAPEEREKEASDLAEEGWYVFEDQPVWTDNMGITSGRRLGLFLYDRKTAALTRVTDPYFHVTSYDTDGRRVLFTGASYEGARPRLAGLYLYSVEDGQTRCLIQPEQQEINLAVLREDHAVFTAKAEESDIDKRIYFDFFEIGLEGGESRLLAPYEHYVGRGTVNSDARLGEGTGIKLSGEHLYFVSTVGHDTQIYRMDKSGQISQPLTPQGSCDSFDVFGEELVYCGFYQDALAELYDGEGAQLTFFNDRYRGTHDLVKPDYFPVKTQDGFDLQGWILKPADYDPGRKYPAILHIHGGPCTVFGTIYHHEMQVWANRGYFVIYCNPRGSDGRGEAFANIRGRYGTVDYQGLMDYLDAALAHYGAIDPNRVGVTGGSYGGYMTNWVIGHTDRFQCAVSQRSISNWIIMEHTSDIGAYFSPREQGAKTAENVEKLWWHSPLKYAAKVVTPTLFIHSDADYRCWMAEALSMYTALKLAGVESRMVLFKGESHELSRSGKPKNRIRRMWEIVDWMDRHLKEEPAEPDGGNA